MEKNESLTSNPCFYPSFLHSSFLSLPFFFPTSLLLPFCFCFNRAPTFLLLPTSGFLLIPIISADAFPLQPSINVDLNDALPNLQASEELTCKHVHRWTLTMQPKQWHEKTFLCTLKRRHLCELKPSSHSLPFTRLPPPLCEQVGPSVGPSFGPVCHRSWYQVILCTTLKLCCIWCICINILSCISHWYHSQTHSRSNCTLLSFLSHNQF